jgi:hypothetical protein
MPRNRRQQVMQHMATFEQQQRPEVQPGKAEEDKAAADKEQPGVGKRKGGQKAAAGKGGRGRKGKEKVPPVEGETGGDKGAAKSPAAKAPAASFEKKFKIATMPDACWEVLMEIVRKLRCVQIV